MDVRGAVQAGPDGDVEGLIEDAAHFRGGDGFAAEAQGADPAARSRWPNTS